MKQPPTSAANQCIACAMAVAAALCVIAPVTHAQCQYEVTAIIKSPQCSFGGTTPLIGRGMNSHGHVAGSYLQCLVTADEAFYWTPQAGTVTLPRPAGVFSAIATDINDDGTIIGRHLVTQHGDWLAFAYHPDEGQFTYLYPKSPLFGTSTLNAINNAGMAVGSRSIGKPGQSPNPSNAVIWNTNTGEVIDLGVMHGPNSSASGINSIGVAVGWTGQSSTSPDSAFEFFEDTYLLGPIPGGTNSVGVAVNDSNIVLGQGRMALPGDTSIHAFVWRDGFLATVGPPDGIVNIGGGDMNNLGQMALTGTITGGDAQPFLWQHEVLHSLADLLGDGAGVVSGRASAMAINDAGQILIRSANTRAAILTPIGQPLGDLNHDCRVDVRDLYILLDAWGSTRTRGQSKSPADLNGDVVVDVSDLLILLANWSPPERR